MESTAVGGLNRRDPKFWPRYLKFATLFNISFFVFLGNMHAAGITTGFVELAGEFQVGFDKLADQVSYAVLAQGLANLLWMPSALCFGKRNIMLLTMVMLLAGCIWGSAAQSFDSLLGSRIFACIGSGSVESIGPSMIADMFFEKNFATAMAVYALALTAGSQIGPLIAGYLIQDRGWRSLFILCAILTAVNLVLAFLFMPETAYHRVWYEGQTAADLDTEANNILEHKNNKFQTTTTTISVDVPQIAVHKGYGSEYWRDIIRVKHVGVDNHGIAFWLYQFSLPWRFLIVPGALFASLAYGVTLGWVVIISTIGPNIFSPPPYNFDSTALGLFGLSAFIGIIITFPIAGPLTDLLSSRLAHRNPTGHKPEHRLPALIAPFLLCPPGLILFAYSYIPVSSYNPFTTYTNPWINPAVGYAMSASGLTLIPSIMLSYVVDAYPATSGEALVLINAAKNVIAFGLTKAAATWLDCTGIKTMFTTMAGIEWCVFAFALPLYFVGPWVRRRSVPLLAARWCRNVV